MTVDPFAPVVERLNKLQPRRSQGTQFRVPETVMRAIAEARKRGVLYPQIFEAVGEEWFKNANSLASTHRAWLRKQKAK